MGAIVTEEGWILDAESRRKSVFLVGDIIHKEGERNLAGSDNRELAN